MVPIKPNLFKAIVTPPAGGYGLALKNAAPTGLVISGCIGIGVGVVLACKATLKADAILDEIEQELEKVEHVRNITDEERYSKQDYDRDKNIVYAKGGAKMAKLYLPAFIVIVGSLAMILGGHKMLLNRHVAMAAALKATNLGYENYRRRVREDLGEDKDREYAYGLKEEVVGVEEFVDDKGKKHKQKIKAQIPSSLASPYAFYWDNTCNGWDNNPYYNETFLIGKQREWNRKLASRWQLNGFVTLAEIKQDLGVFVREADIVPCWTYDPSYKPEEHNGKDQIDFGIFSPRNSDAINGSEPVYILEPNCTGSVYDIPSKR